MRPPHKHNCDWLLLRDLAAMPTGASDHVFRVLLPYSKFLGGGVASSDAQDRISKKAITQRYSRLRHNRAQLSERGYAFGFATNTSQVALIGKRAEVSAEKQETLCRVRGAVKEASRTWEKAREIRVRDKVGRK